MSKTKKLGPYLVGSTLGEGGYATVKLGTHEKTGELVALKIFKAKKVNMKKVEREITAMKSIQHPNVLKLKEYDLNITYNGRKIVLCVLEFAPGGEIMEYLSFTGVFEEPLARTYFHQLIEGVAAAHKLDICHRDIKPENLLLDAKFQLKIADFGLSRPTNEKSDLMTTCGSKGYMSPEMHEDSYDGKLSDVWACGVVLFTMIAGYPPYQELNDGWFQLLQKKNYTVFWNEHSKYVKLCGKTQDLVTRMLSVDPKTRITVDEIMKHQWYQGKILNSKELENVSSQRKKIIEKNRKFKIQDQKNSMEGSDDCTVRELGVAVTSMIFLPDDVIDKDSDEDSQDDNDNDEEDIDLTDDLEDLGITDEGTQEKKEAAPVFSPIKMVFTKFDCSDPPGTVLEGLKESLEKLKFEYNIPSAGYEIECNVKTNEGGEVKFMINVFTHPGDANHSVVEFQRRTGNSGSYCRLYARIRNQMDVFATKR